MKTADAIRHFGSRRALALALGIRPPSVYKWKRMVPPLRQLQLEQITHGRLKAARQPWARRAVKSVVQDKRR